MESMGIVIKEPIKKLVLTKKENFKNLVSNE